MRPEAQVFFHVLGATVLFGALIALAVLGFAGAKHPQVSSLAKASLLTTIAVAVPAWVLMLLLGSSVKSDEHLSSTVEWVRIGNGIALVGIVVLLGAAAAAYTWYRRGTARPAVALAWLSSGYLVALGVAWWVMSTKLPAELGLRAWLKSRRSDALAADVSARRAFSAAATRRSSTVAR